MAFYVLMCREETTHSLPHAQTSSTYLPFLITKLTASKPNISLRSVFFFLSFIDIVHIHLIISVLSNFTLYSAFISKVSLQFVKNRVATNLENLEKSGNLKVIRENRRSRGK